MKTSGTENINAPAHSPAALRGPKIIVAVHGIGDQFQFATIQSVANRFCTAFGDPQALPLGMFYNQPIGKPPETYLLQMPLGRDAKTREEVGFAEIYWADIPRIPEKAGYTLEESKRWGRTVIDRLRPHCKDPNDPNDPSELTPQDLDMAKGLLEEMLDTISVVERLLLLADKAGLFKFSLKEILISYLGDVQLVTDFKKYRELIIQRFFAVMNFLHTSYPNAEIYIVAHSEGTVVTFLSLLEALCGRNQPGVEPEGRADTAALLDLFKDAGVSIPEDAEAKMRQYGALTCEWLNQVKGLMTIGSPIDKHLILWPKIWADYPKCTPRNLPPHKIRWHNYYDYGDPIGFKLDRAHDWLCVNDYAEVFDFRRAHDHGFGRYTFPGKAHNDYWEDAAVFDHFIENVVKPDPIKAGEPVTMSLNKKDDPPPPANPQRPPDRWFNKFLSTVVPYVLVFGLIYLAVYFLYKAVNEYRGTDESGDVIFRNVLGMTCLLAGLTVAAQVPRLTRSWKWRFAAVLLFAAGAVLYYYIPLSCAHTRLGCFIATWFVGHADPSSSAKAVIILATIIAAIVYAVGRKHPRNGLKILLWSSVIALVVMIGASLFGDTLGSTLANRFPFAAPFFQKLSRCESEAERLCAEQAAATSQAAQNNQKDEPRLWPLLLALAAFLYLWWLAALIFDLVVVWHYYIRRSVALEQLYKWTKTSGVERVPIKA
jgi:hypothetical protein